MPSKRGRDPAHCRKSSRIEEVIKDFDPNYTYLLFERVESSSHSEVLNKIFEFMQSVSGVIEILIKCNEQTGTMYLSAKIDPAESESLIMKLAGTELSKSFPLYVYEAETKD